jgi:hypothetical protein
LGKFELSAEELQDFFRCPTRKKILGFREKLLASSGDDPEEKNYLLDLLREMADEP